MSDFQVLPQNTAKGLATNIPAANRSYYICQWQNGKNITAGEYNHTQRIQLEALRKFGAVVSQPGVSYRSLYSAGTNSLTVGGNFALLEDMVLTISADENNGPNVIPLPVAPLVGYRDDLIILEAWLAGIAPATVPNADTSIYIHGGVANATFPNDLQQPAPMNDETMRRVQARWRFRVIQGVNFQGNPDGFLDPSVNPQGGLTQPLATATFTDQGATYTEFDGLWKAGSGSAADAAKFNTVDGYVYALPMFRVTRRVGVPQPALTDIVDLRQTTNSNLVGVFNLQADGSLIVRSDPIRFYNREGTLENGRVTATPVDPTLVSLSGVVAANQVQSTAQVGTAPFIVQSTTLVPFLNANYLQGRVAGTGVGDVLALDPKANAAIDGVQIGMHGGTAGNPFDRVRFANVNGEAWLLTNASWDGAQFTQLDPTTASAAIALTAADTFSSYYALPGAGPGNATTFGWRTAFAVDQASQVATFNTGMVIDGGYGVPGDPLPKQGGLQFGNPGQTRLFTLGSDLYAVTNARLTADAQNWVFINPNIPAMLWAMGDSLGNSMVLMQGISNTGLTGAGGAVGPNGLQWRTVFRVSGGGAVQMAQMTPPTAGADNLIYVDAATNYIPGWGGMPMISRGGVWRAMMTEPSDFPPSFQLYPGYDDEFDYATPKLLNTSLPATATPGGWTEVNPRSVSGFSQPYAQPSASIITIAASQTDLTGVTTNYHSGSQIHGIKKAFPTLNTTLGLDLVAKVSVRLDMPPSQATDPANVGEAGIWIENGTGNILTFSLVRRARSFVVKDGTGTTQTTPLTYSPVEVSISKWTGYTAGSWSLDYTGYTPGAPATNTDRTGFLWDKMSAYLHIMFVPYDIAAQRLRFMITDRPDTSDSSGFLVGWLPYSALGLAPGASPTAVGLFVGGQASTSGYQTETGLNCDYLRFRPGNYFDLSNPGAGGGTGSVPHQPPGEPSAPLATASAGAASVSWAPPADTGGIALTSYSLYRTLVPPGPLAKGTLLPQTPAQLVALPGTTLAYSSTDLTRTSFLDSGLTNGAHYRYYLAASNAIGQGISSHASNDVIPLGVPSAPLNPIGTVGNSLALLYWDFPITDNGSPVRSYTIYRASGGSGYSVIGTATARTYTDYTAVNGVPYAYVISAVNAMGEGPQSAFVTVTPRAPRTSYQSCILAQNPAAYWRLGETSGTTAFDSSGFGHHGAYANSSGLAYYQPGGIALDNDPAVDFLGVNYIRVSGGESGGSAAIAKDFSIEFLLRPRSVALAPGKFGVVISRHAEDYSFINYEVRYGMDGNSQEYLQLLAGSSVSPYVNLLTVPVSLNKTAWNHIVLTYRNDAKYSRLYINGAFSTFASDPQAQDMGPLANSAYPIYLGATSVSGQVEDILNHGLDEVALYAYEMQDWQVSGHYAVMQGNDGVCNPYPPPPPVGPPPVPPPTIGSVTPSNGLTTGSTAITVRGTNFLTGAKVQIQDARFDGTFVNATTLTAITPPHAAGTFPVYVVNPDAQTATLNAGYTYTSPVVTPPAVPAGVTGLVNKWDHFYGAISPILVDSNDSTTGSMYNHITFTPVAGADHYVITGYAHAPTETPPADYHTTQVGSVATTASDVYCAFFGYPGGPANVARANWVEVYAVNSAGQPGPTVGVHNT